MPIVFSNFLGFLSGLLENYKNEKNLKNVSSFSVLESKVSIEFFILFKNFLCHNGDSILKQLKILFKSLEDSYIPLIYENEENSLNLNSKSSSFSQFQIDYNKTEMGLVFLKNEMENDEKTKFLQKIHSFKEIYGLKKKKKLKSPPKKASLSFSKPLLAKNREADQQISFFDKEEYEKVESDMRLLINLSKKEEDEIKMPYWFLEFFQVNENFLKTLKNKLEFAIKNQEALVILILFKFIKLIIKFFKEFLSKFMSIPKKIQIHSKEIFHLQTFKK